MALVYNTPTAKIYVSPYGDKIEIQISIDPNQSKGGTATLYVFPDGTLPVNNNTVEAVLPDNPDSKAIVKKDIPITPSDPSKTVFVKLPEGQFDVLLEWNGQPIFAERYNVSPLNASGPVADSLFILGIGVAIAAFSAKLGSR